MAIEIAILALPFFALIFAVIEGGLVFWTNQTLATAVYDASRKLYTGRFQEAKKSVTGADLQTAFRKEVCSTIIALFDCSALRVDVRTYSSFPGGVPSPIITDADGNRILDPSFGQYQQPGPKQIVVVRAAVEFPVLVPLLGAYGSNMSGGRRLLMGSAAFYTEPF